MDEQREEKRREIRRKTNDDDHHRSQQNHIPLDLTLEILSRLPAKSIVRFGCVSKLWSSFVKLPCFINSFASRSLLRRQPSLLITFISPGGKLIVSSFPQNQNPDGSYPPPVYSCQFIKPSDWNYPCSESVHGLILLHGFKIWNPSLRRFLLLPHPNEHISSQGYSSYLGYDPVECKHKVLSINQDSLQPQVLTLGAQESWRTITKNIPVHRPYQLSKTLCFSGVVYYEADIDDQRIIMSFDLKSENFNQIKKPEGVSDHKMIPYEGRLALVVTKIPVEGVDLYILKDEDGHKWTHQSFRHVPCNSQWRNRLRFKGVTDAGELIFASHCYNRVYVVYFDTRRNSIRDSSFEGIDGGIRRFEVNGNYLCLIDGFPNHIESLLSL